MRPSFTVTTTSNFTARDALRSSFFVAKAPQKGYNVIIGSLSKNSCRGEHCSPVPVCLIRKPSRKARCCAKLAGDQWSPLHSLYSKVNVFWHAVFIISALQQNTRFFASKHLQVFSGFYLLFHNFFGFPFNFAVPTPYSHGVRRQQTDRMFPCKEKNLSATKVQWYEVK